MGGAGTELDAPCRLGADYVPIWVMTRRAEDVLHSSEAEAGRAGDVTDLYDVLVAYATRTGTRQARLLAPSRDSSKAWGPAGFRASRDGPNASEEDRVVLGEPVIAGSANAQRRDSALLLPQWKHRRRLTRGDREPGRARRSCSHRKHASGLVRPSPVPRLRSRPDPSVRGLGSYDCICSRARLGRAIAKVTFHPPENRPRHSLTTAPRQSGVRQ
jgi:hypothetical protein